MIQSLDRDKGEEGGDVCVLSVEMPSLSASPPDDDNMVWRRKECLTDGWVYV